VLDLAAGPGLLARDAARQVLPDGWVLASDIAEGMLAEGQRAAAEGLPDLLAAACDAEHLAFGDGSFDVALIGLGLFIFPSRARPWPSCTGCCARAGGSPCRCGARGTPCR
jgi:ubiquinone/menaquinone biosynthesis C-methylase UbiE